MWVYFILCLKEGGKQNKLNVLIELKNHIYLGIYEATTCVGAHIYIYMCVCVCVFNICFDWFSKRCEKKKNMKLVSEINCRNKSGLYAFKKTRNLRGKKKKRHFALSKTQLLGPFFYKVWALSIYTYNNCSNLRLIYGCPQ
jgi:hypothetical protein